MIQKLKRLWQDKDERNLLINIMLAFGVKGLSLFVSLFSMPLYIKYFDNQSVLGIWYTILSLLTWISMCDLGLGNGLRNKLTEALAQGERDKAKKYISSTYVSLTLIIIPILLVGALFLNLIDLNRALSISESVLPARALRLSVIILFCGICISFVVKTVNAIIYALQKSSLNNVLSFITSVLPLVFVWCFKGEDVGVNLISLSVVHVLAINIPLLAATFAIFARNPLKECRPAISCCDKKTATSMLGFGMKFFFAQIFFMFLMSTNEIFITKFFSAADVVDYSIYYRLFTAVGSLFMLALTPLWSKVTRDLTQKKYAVIQKTNRVLYLLAAVAGLAQLAILPFLQWIINIWLGDEAIAVHMPTAMIFALFGSLYIFNVVLTTVANGMGELRTQMLFYGIGAALKIPAVFLLTRAGRSIMWNIVPLFNCVVLAVFCIYQLVWIERKIKQLI